jgi:hypothetical protein
MTAASRGVGVAECGAVPCLSISALHRTSPTRLHNFQAAQCRPSYNRIVTVNEILALGIHSVEELEGESGNNLVRSSH